MKAHKIFLVRHGESEGNVDKNIYAHTPDCMVNLTTKGVYQATKTAQTLLDKVASKSLYKCPVAIYCSPFMRARQTALPFTKLLVKLALEFNKDPNDYIKYVEDPGLVEQSWGNFMDQDTVKAIKKDREKIGSFFYKFPNGESGVDVFNRVSRFNETLYRDFQKKDFPQNVVIFSHGFTIRVFLMRWFHWSYEEFQEIRNIKNAEIVEMVLNNNKYNLTSPLKRRSNNTTIKKIWEE